MAKYRVGVDVGGTFTDLVMVDPSDGSVRTTKTPSTPSRPDQAIVDGLGQLGVALEDIEYFAHGTTVGTNALITGDLPRTALICTAGHRDVLQIGRGPRQDLWDAYADMAPPLAMRRDRFTVGERLDYTGAVVQPLDADRVREIARTLTARGIQTVAVCLLHSYVNGAHEREVRDILAKEAPGVAVSLSHEVLPEIFEFERTSTTVINAALMPVVVEYLTTLDARLKSAGFGGDLLILHSGGGVMKAHSVQQLPARIAKSGPAAGGAAMTSIAQACGVARAIGLDVGGTSSDISLMIDGELRRSNETSVNYGQPILFPSIDVVTIGAGGGSVAWIDDGGSLRNGPMSQRADPGPACYMMGGTVPTNTDAQLVLGRLPAEGFLGGRMQVSRDAAVEAIRSAVAEPLDMDLAEAASAVVKVATANMANATRLITTKRGYDPAEFALVAFGGAGPLFGAELAEELGISTVIMPKWPGITSAYGCLVVNTRHDLSQTFIAKADTIAFADLDVELARMEQEATERLRTEGFSPEDMVLERQIDMRYHGQWRSLTIDLTGVADTDSMLARFHEEHGRAYSYADPERAVEIYGLRVAGVGVVPQVDLTDDEDDDYGEEPAKTRAVYFEGAGYVESGIHTPAEVRRRGAIAGPAIIEQMDTTMVVPPHWTAEAHPSANIILVDTRRTTRPAEVNKSEEAYV